MGYRCQLEDLPDEILIEICRYLSRFDILYSFGRLNSRLQCTIAEFRFKLDISDFSFNQFQYFCSSSFLTFIGERLIKLSLSNACATGQIELFGKNLDNDSFKNTLPLLKSITLSEFTNNNVEILSKLLYLEELNIEFSSYEKLTSTTEFLINSYIFSTFNNFRKVKLLIDEGIQLRTQVNPNICLEELIIQIATINDLSILFALAPYLVHLELCIVRNTSQELVPQFRLNVIPQLLKEFYIQTVQLQVIPFQDLLRPLICNIPSIEYLSVSVKTDDPDYAEAHLWKDMISVMPSLKTFLLGLEIQITTSLLNHFSDGIHSELKLVVFNSFAENFDLSSSFRIYTNVSTLFIDSVPYRFNREQSYNTSPEAVRALCTNTAHLEQPSHNIVGLTMNGEHVPIIKNDYLEVIRQFSSITWLSLSSINVYDQENEIDAALPVSLKLKYLNSLFYCRSTECKVNRVLFDQLFYGHKRLDTLKMMYGDLIYLLRTASPSINGNHIKDLELFCQGADGAVRLLDLNHLILTFPQLECLSIQVVSSKLIKKNQVEIIEELIRSFRRLRSFRVNCTRGTLKLARSLMKNDQMRFEWLTHVNAIGSHLIVEPKTLALWKSVDTTIKI